MVFHTSANRMNTFIWISSHLLSPSNSTQIACLHDAPFTRGPSTCIYTCTNCKVYIHKETGDMRLRTKNDKISMPACLPASSSYPPPEFIRNIPLDNLHPIEHLLPLGGGVHLVVFPEMRNVFWVGEVFFAGVCGEEEKGVSLWEKGGGGVGEARITLGLE